VFRFSVAALNLASDVFNLPFDLRKRAVELSHNFHCSVIDLSLDLRPIVIELSVELGRAVIERTVNLIELSFKSRDDVFQPLVPNFLRTRRNCRGSYETPEPAARQDDHAHDDRKHPDPAPAATPPSAGAAVSAAVASRNRGQHTDGDARKGQTG
jgi:hypothetical protein